MQRGPLDPISPDDRPAVLALLRDAARVAGEMAMAFFRAGAVTAAQIDYKAGVDLAMGHLFDLRHRNIAFISGPLSLGSAQVRARAFREALQRRGVLTRPDWIQEGDHRVEGGAKAMGRILQSGKRRPTAVLASNDLTAIGAMGALHEAGLRIPEDISVIGFDGIELSAYTQPALTTLQVSRVELAALAFRSLWQHKTTPVKKLTAKQRIVQPALVVRGSTAPPPKKSPKQAPLPARP